MWNLASPRLHPSSTNQSEAASQEQSLGSARKTLDLSHHDDNISSSDNSDEQEESTDNANETNDNTANTELPKLPPPHLLLIQIPLWKLARKTSFQLIMLSFSTAAYYCTDPT